MIEIGYGPIFQKTEELVRMPSSQSPLTDDFKACKASIVKIHNIGTLGVYLSSFA